LGKYAVTGNHEFISGIEYSTDFITKCGFRLIRNSLVNVRTDLNIAGIDDPTGRRFLKTEKNIHEETFMSGINPGKYTILLKHQPKINKKATRFFDLQLSGHTHGGQIFPFTLAVKLAFPYIYGLYSINDNTTLYVSRGTGTWGPPIRFLAPAEITVITLLPEE
jgi:predicted MPP superfamily phosphohydrolase